MDTPTDYYVVLGIEPLASASTIKSAFKKLALQYHPDIYKGEDAQQRMRDLLQAYQTLSDPEKRQAYDSRREGKKTLVDVADRPMPRKGSSDGQGHFAFPELSAELLAPVVFKLDGIQYELSSAQAESLWWTGLLRGTFSLSTSSLSCQRCLHHWSAAVPPQSCPACHASDWSEYLLLRCTHCQAVFASREVHDPLRGNVLYQPYELFPLCPSCRRSHWCQAENERVNALRATSARRSSFIWGSFIVVVVVLVILIVLTLANFTLP